MMWNIGDYAYSTDLRQICRIIETQTLWGETFYRVWLPHQDTAVRVRADRLKSLQEASTNACDGITYIAVRSHRLAQLEREEQDWREQIKRQAQVSPDLVPLLLLRLEGGTSGG